MFAVVNPRPRRTQPFLEFPVIEATMAATNTPMPRIALLQSKTFATKGEAFDHHESLIRKAASGGAQIIATQELFLTPYFCTVEDTSLFDLADRLPGPVTERLGALAAELGVVIVSSLFEHRGPGLYHNTAAIHDADGSLLGIYRKSHIPQDPGFEEKFYFTPGDSGWPVWETAFGKIGVLICWDQWYPEAARLMALGGAELLIYPTAIGWLPAEKEELGAAQHCAWETVQRGHAVANGCYVAAINRAGTHDGTEFWGQSFVANPYGEIVAKASVEQEEIVHHDVDFAKVEDFRRIWPFFRDRRIDAYGDITLRWRGK
jgi:N-carbamoylputrescine amidase